jgi:hypothetical protein
MCYYLAKLAHDSSKGRHMSSRANTDYTFFWKSDSPFSNWHPSEFVLPFPWHLIDLTRGNAIHRPAVKALFSMGITFDDLKFNCVEKYMMFAKSLLMGDYITAAKILKETRPNELKRLGREVSPWNEELWIEHRFNIVFDACWAKFTQNEHLRDEMLSTGTTKFAEASPKDAIWGLGISVDDPRINTPAVWTGLNLLGQVLDKVKARLRTQPVIKRKILPWMSVQKREPRVALMVGRFQPLHRAHCMVIERMLQDNDVVIIGIGSAQESKTQRNPYHAEIRMAMLKNVFGNRIVTMPLRDLGSGVHTQEWITNVIGKCHEMRLPTPNRYYCGCHDDSLWYQGYFSGTNPKKIEVGDMVKYVHTSEDRELIILERTMNHYPSATRIREYMNLRMEDWKWWIPEVNHVLVEANYPAQFRTALEVEDFSEFTDIQPEGTFVYQPTNGEIYQKINGVYQPKRESVVIE